MTDTLQLPTRLYRKIKYVEMSDRYMQAALHCAKSIAHTSRQPTGAVVRNGTIIGFAAGELPYPSERQAVFKASSEGEVTQDAVLYLWGACGCSEDSWKAIVEAGVQIVFLIENCEILFNKEHPQNILGRQFD